LPTDSSVSVRGRTRAGHGQKRDDDHRHDDHHVAEQDQRGLGAVAALRDPLGVAHLAYELSFVPAETGAG
jgi:hypothetical protein